MSDSGSYIQKKRDLGEIIRLQDTGALEEFLEEPLAAIAEATTGWLAAGPGYWASAAGRIVQGALKGKVFEQVAKEIQHLREKGRIPDDYAEKKYGFKSWVELLTLIDEETPDEDRLEALKAMFYAVNKVGATDAEKILGYQLFQIAKKLSSGQLLFLKSCYERMKSPPPHEGDARKWLVLMSHRLGHNIPELVEQDERVLMDHRLLTGRGPLNGPNDLGVNDTNSRLTTLGIRFCENVATYCGDLSGPSNG